jgi:hypothetical protein
MQELRLQSLAGDPGCQPGLSANPNREDPDMLGTIITILVIVVLVLIVMRLV